MDCKEQTLDIPADGLKCKTAFSMDIGGSLTKVVYATDEGEKVRLHMVTYPRPKTREAVELLREKFGGRQPDGSVMNTCGVGFQEYADVMKQELNITVQVNEELNCFMEAFKFMAHRLPFEQLVYLDPPEFKQMINQMSTLIAGGVNALSGHGQHWAVAEDLDAVRCQGVEFPVLFCMLGSGGACIKVNADGSFKICEQLTRCGRTILGLANLFVGAKTFPQLMELAYNGDASELHIQAKHLLRGAGDVYDQVPGDFMVYSFGQAASKDKDSFKKEDIAAALVGMLCEDMAQTCHLVAMAHNIRQIFLCGSVVGASPYIRQQMNVIMSVKDTLNSLSQRHYTYFLRYGGYYGAIGALLRTLKPNEN